MNKENVIILTDLTKLSHMAIKMGFDFAKKMDCGVVLVHIHKGIEVDNLVNLFPEFEGRAKEFTKTFKDNLEQKLRDQLNSFQTHDIPISYKLFYSEHFDKYLEVSETLNSRLMVVPAIDSEFDSIWSGSVVEQLVRTSRVPVLIVKKTFNDIKKIIVPFAFQGLSDSALELGGRLASDFNAKIIGIHVSKKTENKISLDSLDVLDKFANGEKETINASRIKLKLKKLKDDKLLECVTVLNGEGHPKEVLFKEINALKPDLILMGSSGKSGLERLYLGSFCEYILKNTSFSLLIVKDS